MEVINVKLLYYEQILYCGGICFGGAAVRMLQRRAGKRRKIHTKHDQFPRGGKQSGNKGYPHHTEQPDID